MVFRTGSRKDQFISSRFDSPTLYLIIYASDGTLNARHGCDSIRHHGMQKSNANIAIVFQAQSSAGLMPGMAGVFCDVKTARQLRKRCVTLMVIESRKSLGW